MMLHGYSCSCKFFHELSRQAVDVMVDCGADLTRLVASGRMPLAPNLMTSGSWLFAERCLYFDWLEERALS